MPSVVRNITKETDYNTIQSAIDDADSNNVIVASEGCYFEKPDFGIKSITLRSVAPDDWSVVNNTRIYGLGQYGGSVINLANNNNNCVISGLTIIYGDYGIYCDNSNPTINCCQIKNNTTNGIYCKSSNPTITHCTFTNNEYGIYCEDSNLTINRCRIEDNWSSGIYADYADIVVDRCDIANNSKFDNYDGIDVSGGSAVIKNNIIHHNAGYSGIYLNYVQSAEIRNNTIADNSRGICGDCDPNIKNNIIWGNDVDSLDGTFTKVNYNCIEGNYPGINNINLNPQFRDVNDGVDDYHLAYDSNCIDKGDPYFSDANEKDIDGENRIMDGNNDGNSRVDIGADEFCPYDLSQDGFVDFSDFAVFARSWKTLDGNANYNDRCDFYNDGKIDYKDLYIFCNHWLWPFDGNNISGSEEMMMSMESEQEFSSESMAFEIEQEFMEEPQEDDWSSMLAGEGETASIYLICDVNEPNSGDEVTVQIYSDVPLCCMGAAISVAGDAN
ncbi:MAG: right-handed parallel beta-helix repeat-containing protein, partial [Sedimentisphaerales bacterium]